MGYTIELCPIPQTCPKIDRSIGKITDAMAFGKEMLAELETVSGFMEELREENMALRKWGEEQSKLVSELKEEISKLKQ